LKCVVHVDQEGIVELSEYLSFVHDTFDASFGDDSGLAHFLHSVVLFGLLTIHLPNFPEAALANAVQVVEVRLR
jgi:hypothetical protein